MRLARAAALIAVIVATLAPSPASAQTDPDAFPGGAYFYDAEAIGLVYVPLAITAAVELGFDPPTIPRLFSALEGGAKTFGNTVPEHYVGLGGALIAGAMFIPIREGRWFHIKGMAQSVSLSLAITSIGKNVFGRRRPHWSPTTAAIADTRRSFPSGHSSTSFSIASYTCMFLLRDTPGVLEGAGCALVLAGAGLTAYSRVRDRRHHKSDVIAGAILGTITSVAMFTLAESRYQIAVDNAPIASAGPGPLALGWGGTF